jgi:hypothetical protein
MEDTSMKRLGFVLIIVFSAFGVFGTIVNAQIVWERSSYNPPLPSEDNVVAYWRFDEGSGNILHDASPYHNDGVIHNAEWVHGRSGSALHFDGLTSYVILPNSPSLQPKEEFTLEAWISPDTLEFDPSPYERQAVIVSNLGTYPCGGGYQLYLEDPGGLRFNARSTNCISNFSEFTPINQSRIFYHVACVYKQIVVAGETLATVKTYLNGIRTDSTVISAPIQYTSAPYFYIGTNIGGRAVGFIGVREFPGIIDEIRILNVALEPSQFNLFPVQEDNVVAHWRFDEGSGNILHDASPYHNDGVIHNAEWVRGRSGSALHFDGLTSYVILPNSPSLKLENEFTLEVWLSLDTLDFGYIEPLQGTIPTVLGNLGPYPSGGGYQIVVVDNARLMVDIRTGSPISRFSGRTAIPQARKFYHFAATYQRVGGYTILKSYLNGNLTDSTVFVETIHYNSTQYFYIGTNIDGRAVGGAGVREFPGIIDEIRISKVALEPHQFLLFPHEFTWYLHVSDTAGNSERLEYGVAQGATEGLDSIEFENELPPVPPAGTFDARWIIPNSNGSLLNYQDTLGGEHTFNTYVGNVQPSLSAFPITLAWSPTAFPEGTFLLRDHLTQGTLYNVNMKAANSFRISEESQLPFEIVYNNSPTILQTVVRGWNLLSLPVSVENKSTSTLFPTATSQAYSFENKYIAVDSLDYAKGYWLKFDEQQTIFVSGGKRSEDIVNVVRGWNMIGSLSSPFSTSSIVSIPEGIVNAPIYEYNKGYKRVTSINPMKGYWVRSSTDGQLILSAATNVQRLSVTEINDIPTLNTLRVQDAEGNSEMVYFGIDDDGTIQTTIEWYSLPPVPPAGMFDVRFENNRSVIVYPSQREGTLMYKMHIQAADGSLTLSWNVVQEHTASYSLNDAVTGKEVVANMKGNGTAVIGGNGGRTLSLIVHFSAQFDVPVEYALEQNYPNPFNPTTLITYALPAESFVSLRVYNMVGEEVQTLVSERQPAGYHTVVWDGSSLPSGVYIYRMNAGASSFVRKMILMK